MLVNKQIIQYIMSFCGGMLIGGVYGIIYEPFSLYWFLFTIPCIILWAAFLNWVSNKYE